MTWKGNQLKFSFIDETPIKKWAQKWDKPLTPKERGIFNEFVRWNFKHLHALTNRSEEEIYALLLKDNRTLPELKNELTKKIEYYITHISDKELINHLLKKENNGKYIVDIEIKDEEWFEKLFHSLPLIKKVAICLRFDNKPPFELKKILTEESLQDLDLADDAILFFDPLLINNEKYFEYLLKNKKINSLLYEKIGFRKMLRLIYKNGYKAPIINTYLKLLFNSKDTEHTN
jgi:hypothetical protein